MFQNFHADILSRATRNKYQNLQIVIFKKKYLLLACKSQAIGNRQYYHSYSHCIMRATLVRLDMRVRQVFIFLCLIHWNSESKFPC